MDKGLYTKLNLEANRLSEILIRRDGISVERLPDAMEDQIASGDRLLTAQTLTKLSYRIGDLRRAMEKLEEDTYETCDDCDEEIPLKRHAAVLEAVRCTKCQDVVDQRRQTVDRLPLYVTKQ
jgi:RNA polymerase-binding transcription factor DksA